MDNKRISFELKSLNNYIMRKIITEGKKLHNTPPSPVQLRTIIFLTENIDKEIYQKDIEKELKLRRSTISGILKTMEKHNIIIKSNALNDARSRKIELSKEAIEKHKNLMDEFKKLDIILKEGITDKELETFFKVIDKMKENIVR